MQLIGKILSETMATPTKPTLTGKDSRALPDLTVLTGTRPDGTPVPTKPRHIIKPMDESPNQTITSTPDIDKLRNSSGLSIELMQTTSGWNADTQSWNRMIEEEEKEKLDQQLQLFLWKT